MHGLWWSFIRGLLILLAVAGSIGWLIYRSLKRSDEPERLLVKLAVTGLIILAMAFTIPGFAQAQDATRAFIVILGAVYGIILGIIWAPTIGAIVSKPFTSLYDGGDQEVTPEPFYSIAHAKRKQAKFQEAIAEVHRQLARFPGDFAGQMLLADIQAEDLKDLQAAEMTVHRLIAQPELPPENITAALHHLADWHLKIHQDQEAARQALEKVVELFPDTLAAQTASQRIAHLCTAEPLVSSHDRRKITVAHSDQRLGLRKGPPGSIPPAGDPAAVASHYVKHLEQYPLDSEAREKLALIYADHYQRLDLAMGELEQLITQPNQSAKQVVHWLNLVADLQIKYAADALAASQTLQRIIDQFPGSAGAEVAERRKTLLKLEGRANEKSQAIKLGSYDNNLGLKQP